MNIKEDEVYLVRVRVTGVSEEDGECLIYAETVDASGDKLDQHVFFASEAEAFVPETCRTAYTIRSVHELRVGEFYLVHLFINRMRFKCLASTLTVAEDGRCLGSHLITTEEKTKAFVDVSERSEACIKCLQEEAARFKKKISNAAINTDTSCCRTEECDTCSKSKRRDKIKLEVGGRKMYLESNSKAPSDSANVCDEEEGDDWIKITSKHNSVTIWL